VLIFATLTREVHQVRSPALRYHGAKFRPAPWIQQFFPAHRNYVAAHSGVLNQNMEALESVML
jgi:hypothetical protein